MTPLIALVILGLNDLWLKGHGPGWLTGKLSDLAGLFLLPLILVSLIEVGRKLRGSRWQATARLCAFISSVVAIGFVLVKTLPPVASAYGMGIGILRWPVSTLATIANGRAVEGPRPIEVIVDATDLVALIAVLCACLYMRRRRPK